MKNNFKIYLLLKLTITTYFLPIVFNLSIIGKYGAATAMDWLIAFWLF